MTVLGPAILDNAQQDAIEAGATELRIRRDAVFADAAERAQIGDFWWCKERYCEVRSGPTGPQHVHEMIPGSPRGMVKNIPPHLKAWFHLLRQLHGIPARGPRNRKSRGLSREESRACLKIFEITDEGFRCEVHMQNVDVFLCRAA